MKTELGYYLVDSTLTEIKVPIYGLRAIPEEVIERQWRDASYGNRHWQVEILNRGEYVWVNQSRHLIFLH